MISRLLNLRRYYHQGKKGNSGHPAIVATGTSVAVGITTIGAAVVTEGTIVVTGGVVVGAVTGI